MPVFEIPLTPSNKRFSIPLSGKVYQFVLIWRDADEGGWILDINDAAGVPMICGIPLVTGMNLLEAYRYLDFAGELWVATDGNAADTPTFRNLGLASHLYWVTRP